MYRILLLLMIVSLLAGCAAEAPPSASPSPEITKTGDWPERVFTIHVNGEEVTPYERLEWQSTFTPNGWLAGCGDMTALFILPEIKGDLPLVEYDDEMTFEIGDGGTVGETDIYDMALERIHFRVSHEEIYALPQGEYYVGIRVIWTGPYVTSEGKNESSCHDYLFHLSK